MADQTDFDLIVLGLGPGGEDVAGALAEAGRSVLGLDERLVGGECPYFGCIPSKMILRGADLLAEARRVPGMAGESSVTPDFAPVAQRIRDEATDDWDDRVAVERLEGKGATVVHATGRLAGRDDDGRLRVEADGQAYRAAHVVVATGTAPALPPIDGLAELRASAEGVDGPVWTNREALRARSVPASLVVVGGGSIGCELAQGFARFGTRVSLVEVADRILGLEEPEAAQAVADVFADEGIEVHQGGAIASVGAGGDGVTVTLDDGTRLTGEKVLVAAGRRPNLDIGLDTVGLDPSVRSLTAAGKRAAGKADNIGSLARSLTVDEHMRVTGADGADEAVDGLYAIGDIAGHGQFTHVAMWQSRVLTAHLLGADEPFGGYHGLAWATFTDPEVGRVGLTEAQAREKGLRVRVGTQQIASNSRGWIHGPGNAGLVKLVEDAERGVLVGATVVSPYGGEILGLLSLAVHAEVPVRTLRTMHYAFPTLHRAVLEALADLG